MATPPNTFVAGTTAASAEVNENFTDIYARFLDKTGDTATGTLNFQHILPVTDATYDLGSGSFQFRNLYISGSVIGPSASNAFGTVAVSGQTDVDADTSSDTLTLVAGNGITITTTPASDSVTISATTGTAGGSSVVPGVTGVVYQTYTATGNVGAGEDTLWSQTIAANILNTDGMALWGEASGTFAANGANKTVKVKFGSTTIMTLAWQAGSTAAQHWFLQFKIKRTGSSTQKAVATITACPTDTGITTVECGYATPAEDLTSTVAFTITGEATTTNDIVLQEGTIRIDGVPS